MLPASFQNEVALAYSNPTLNDFKARFARDFPFGTDPAEAVLDGDIATAFDDASIGINPSLFDSQLAYTKGYLLLAAHNLVLNLRASSQGINGQFAWLEASKSVGGVAQAFSIPQHILDNPTFAMFTKSNYGAMYLAMILPALSGAAFSVWGGTQP